MSMAKSERDRQALQQTMKAIIAGSKRTSAKASSQASLPGLEVPTHSRAARPQSHDSELPDRVAELVHSIPVQRRLSDLVLAPQVVDAVEEFIDEFSQAPLLRSHSLEPRHTVLLLGPPGNGKTSLAEAMATELSLPLLSVRYDAIVDSFLGETSNRLRRLIEYATQNPCVLFFDEFEAVGKERSDAQETGEIKRVVSTLLVQMDRLPSHTVIVCATNHPELLDRAVWRRFEIKLEIDKPGPQQLKEWFQKFEASLEAPSGITPQEFADHMRGESMATVEAFTLDVRRKVVLSRGKISPAEAVRLVIARGNALASTVIIKEQSSGDKLSDRATKARTGRTRKS
ncbi:ATP-dependent zinc metalloprotease FtsH 3 [Delftia sp. K82]|nr:ATP-dependent zinc metalloprotease FtsH 3 [Delftia sp. K82]